MSACYCDRKSFCGILSSFYFKTFYAVVPLLSTFEQKLNNVCEQKTATEK